MSAAHVIQRPRVGALVGRDNVHPLANPSLVVGRNSGAGGAVNHDGVGEIVGLHARCKVVQARGRAVFFQPVLPPLEIDPTAEEDSLMSGPAIPYL